MQDAGDALKDALVVFDVNVPKPRSNNCMTVEGFYKRLGFEAELIEIEAGMKEAEDPALLKWVIHHVANLSNKHKAKWKYKYTFFVTKDGEFEKDSKFNSLIRLLNKNARIVVITIPAYEEIKKPIKGGISIQRRVLKRKQLLEIIVNKLNKNWKNRSPR